ncbi:MAG: hypothetical protein PHE61_03900, partial [Candidatus Omnitrophica bacterium]|nr:hypothetical protein [Candidatus Omnitrophota bacterium]
PRKQVVFVDDYDGFLHVMQRGIVSDKLEITTYHGKVDQQSAYEIANLKPDILFFDVSHTKIPCSMTCQILRSRQSLHDIPIYLISTHAKERQKELALADHINGIIEKFGCRERIIEILRSHFGAVLMEKELAVADSV